MTCTCRRSPRSTPHTVPIVPWVQLKKDAYEAGDKFVQTVIDNLPKSVGKDVSAKEAVLLEQAVLQCAGWLPRSVDWLVLHSK